MEIKWNRPETEKLSVHEKNGAVWFSFPMLDALDCVISGFSTRLGGVSEGHLSSMNLSFSRGDDPERVRENYRRMCDCLGIRPEQLVTTAQTHTTNVLRVGREDCHSSGIGPTKLRDTDGLITDVPGVCLAAFFADCVPLYFVDPVNRAAGLSHSGWKGTVNRMAEVTVRAMQREFGTDPGRLYAALGPSICASCYEVSEDVIDQVRDAFSAEHHSRLFRPNGKPGKYQLDLWEANRQILLEAGVAADHISLPNLCTCCNPDLLFSHRASKGLRGNLGAFLVLRDPGDNKAEEIQHFV